jgi:hypothetical protein
MYAKVLPAGQIGEQLVSIIQRQSQELQMSPDRQLSRESVQDWQQRTKEAERHVNDIIKEGLLLEIEKEGKKKKASENGDVKSTGHPELTNSVTLEEELVRFEK